MKESVLPQKTKLLWQIRIALVGLVPSAVLLALSSVSLWFTAAGGFLLLLLIAAVFWYVPAYFDSYSLSFPKAMGLSALSLKAARSSVTIPELSVTDAERFINAVTGDERR